jgi:hypothetical protein
MIFLWFSIGFIAGLLLVACPYYHVCNYVDWEDYALVFQQGKCLKCGKKKVRNK